MAVLKNIAAIATCAGDSQEDIGLIEDGALAWRDGRVCWVGPVTRLPEEYDADESIDAGRTLVVPGLVDCHTHLAFGGWRADEFRERCRGASYAEIARRGGGIERTVAATRSATVRDLVQDCLDRLESMARLGITTVECKSGYGLNTETEVRILEVYQSLASRTPVRLVSTFLAHGVPGEHAENRDAYVRMLLDETLPAASPLADFCDVFVEEGAFRADEGRRILRRAQELGMQSKVHADQLSESGGSRLAAEVGAVSADHLEHASDAGIGEMARAGVVGVLLPLATTYLRQTPLDARRLLDRGVDVAVATDFNPGSAPSYHLPLAMTLACIQSGLTPHQALKGATLKAAQAVGRADIVGSLEPGKCADFILVDAPSVDHWLYHFRPNAVRRTYIGGIAIPVQHV